VLLEGPDLPSRSWDTLSERLRKVHFAGWVDLAPRILALLPSGREPDLVDSAITRCRSLLGSPQESGLPTLQELRLVVVPGEVTGRPRSWRASDTTPGSLDGSSARDLDPGIYLTGRAAQIARGDWRLATAPAWLTEAGPVIPLFRLAGWRTEMRAPWHHRALFGSETSARPRPQVEKALENAVTEPLVRVTGPVGVGKSRAVAGMLAKHPHRPLWAAVGRWGLSLAEQWLERALEATAYSGAGQVLQRLSAAPDPRERGRLAGGFLAQLLARKPGGSASLALVADDWHLAADGDRRLVAQLLAEPGGRVPIVLAGRPGCRWPDGSPGTVVQVPPWPDSLLAQHGSAVTAGLELPAEVLDRFLAAAAGNPLFLEEGLLALIHRRELRRVYGSFFFAGDRESGYEPSERLSAHLLSEADRLGGVGPLSILGATGLALPEEAVERVGRDLGLPRLEGWSQRFTAIGWLRTTETPWGPGTVIAAPAVAVTFRSTLPDDVARSLQVRVGRALRDDDSTPAARWQVYELLRRTEEAPTALLEAIPKGAIPADMEPEDVLEALRDELDAVRGRGGDEKAELDLLWPLLPLAHRLGRLADLQEELERTLELCAGVPDKEIAVATLQAELAESRGRPREAESPLRRALELAVAHRHRAKTLLTLQLGRLLAHEERYEEARRLLEQLLPELERAGAGTYAATCRFHLGNIALHQRRFDDALLLHHRALTDRRELGSSGPVQASLCALGTTGLEMGDYRQAIEHFRDALEVAPAEEAESLDRSIALLGLGTALFRLGQYSEATVPVKEAARIRASRDSHLGEALCLIALADLYLELQQTGLAHEAARQALFRLSLLDETAARGDAERVLGRTLIRQEEHEAARAHLREAESLHRRHHRPADVVEDLGWLTVEALTRENREDVEVLVRRLEAALEEGPYPARGEIVDHQLFAALEWLETQGSRLPATPLRFLRRAYRELLRKTSYLDADQRPHFLMQIQPHREIVDAATRHGLSMPVFV
jgi:tetratricopeptide (TPR) repeat protein